MHPIKYFSLDEAREELKKRWGNEDLKKKIKEYLAENFISYFDSDLPRAVSGRQIVSPDNGFHFFYQEAKYLNTKPTIIEYLEDVFVSFNEEKKGYGRLHLNNGYVDILNFEQSERKILKDLKIVTGESLIDFHHDLIKKTDLDIEIFDLSAWFKKNGKAKDYYYPLLLHFIAHGVLFENFIFDLEDINESKFTTEVISPIIQRIKKEFDLEPIIIKMYPDNQTELEDLYWWGYPPYILKYILEYIQNNSLLIKK